MLFLFLVMGWQLLKLNIRRIVINDGLVLDESLFFEVNLFKEG